MRTLKLPHLLAPLPSPILHRRRAAQRGAHRRRHWRGALLRECLCSAGPRCRAARPPAPALLPAGKGPGSAVLLPGGCRPAPGPCVISQPGHNGAWQCVAEQGGTAAPPAPSPKPSVRAKCTLTHITCFPLLNGPLQDAQAAVAKFQLLVLVDVRRPVANFGYEGGPSHIITLQVQSRLGGCAHVVYALCTYILAGESCGAALRADDMPVGKTRRVPAPCLSPARLATTFCASVLPFQCSQVAQ